MFPEVASEYSVVVSDQCPNNEDNDTIVLDVFVPMDFVIGGEKNVGKGWQMLVACLGAGRGVSLPANGCATGHATLKSTSEYAAIREQFGMPIGKFEGIQEQLALIGGLTFNLEAMRHLVLNSLDLGFKPSGSKFTFQPR